MRAAPSPSSISKPIRILALVSTSAFSNVSPHAGAHTVKGCNVFLFVNQRCVEFATNPSWQSFVSNQEIPHQQKPPLSHPPLLASSGILVDHAGTTSPCRRV